MKRPLASAVTQKENPKAPQQPLPFLSLPPPLTNPIKPYQRWQHQLHRCLQHKLSLNLRQMRLRIPQHRICWVKKLLAPRVISISRVALICRVSQSAKDNSGHLRVFCRNNNKGLTHVVGKSGQTRILWLVTSVRHQQVAAQQVRLRETCPIHSSKPSSTLLRTC